MPKISGIEAAKLVSRERPGMCVLLMTGAFDEENPGFPVLHKPFNTTKLNETVKGLLPGLSKNTEAA